MLNRARLLDQLNRALQRVIVDTTPHLMRLKPLWEKMVSDPHFLSAVSSVALSRGLPLWEGSLAQCVPIPETQLPYAVIAVDGSQIYPDRHQGFDCCLINVGTVELQYGFGARAQVQLHAIPYLIEQIGALEHESLSVDVVNRMRTEYEFAHVLALAQQYKRRAITPTFLFVDGTIIFWMLNDEDDALCLASCLATLVQLYHERTPLVGYISMPKSRELVNVLSYAREYYASRELHVLCQEEGALGLLTDSDLVSLFLMPGERTGFFVSNLPITQQYDPAVRPYFCYMHTGEEIVRLEFPAWCVHEGVADQVCSAVIDQVAKGNGYPVALAEAHEAAVVKGPDRDFFFQLLRTLSVHQGQMRRPSQKSMKKRGMHV